MTVKEVKKLEKSTVELIIEVKGDEFKKAVDDAFKKNISSKEIESVSGMKKYVWHVKAPDHRLTHLLVHGHDTPTGGRTRANPFLKNALAEVLPEYEKAVEEAARNG